MSRDPVVDEARAIKEKLAARFNFDVRAIGEDARKRQGTNGRTVLSPPPKPLVESKRTAAPGGRAPRREMT